MKKEITVIALVPAFNAGTYLRAAVESLINQTRPLDRIIVIDDASTDNSISSIEDYEESGLVEIYRNEINFGKAQSLNSAFMRYDADYFILQDADDIAKPERIARQMHFMEEDTELACSSTFIEYIDATGRRIGNGELDLLNEDRLNDYLKSNEPFGLFCPAVILRAIVVQDETLQFRGQFWPADDIDLWNRIAEAGYKVRAQPEYLVKYRIHGDSAVTSNFKTSRMQFEWLRQCLRARRAGAPEPSEAEFIEKWKSASLFIRMNRYRKMSAKCLYRAAGFALAQKRYCSAISKLSTAILLDPRYSLTRLCQQFRL